MKVRYFNKGLLSELNSKSNNRKVTSKFIESLQEDILLPVESHMQANEDSVRCKIVFNEKGNTF